MPRLRSVCDGLMSCSKNSVRNATASFCRSRRSWSCRVRLSASSPKTLSSSDIGTRPCFVTAAVGPSQNKTHRAEQAELLLVEDGAALGDLEPAALALEPVAIVPDEDSIEIVVAEAMNDEIRRHRDHVAVDGGNAHIADQPPRPRHRIF